MAYTDQNTPVIEKIKLPSGNEYYIADREIRDVVDALEQTIAGGVSFIIAWDGNSTPTVGNIPAGVQVVYNGTTYTGTLAASSATPGAFYLVRTKTITEQTQQTLSNGTVTLEEGGASYGTVSLASSVSLQPGTYSVTSFVTPDSLTGGYVQVTYGGNTYSGNHVTAARGGYSTYTFTLASATTVSVAGRGQTENAGVTFPAHVSFSDGQIIKSTDLDIYDEYVPVGSSGSKTWEKIGDTQLTVYTASSPISISNHIISHNTSGVTPGTYAATQESMYGTVNIPSFTVDSYGHVTGANASGFTIPQASATSGGLINASQYSAIATGVDSQVRMSTAVINDDATSTTVTLSYNTAMGMTTNWNAIYIVDVYGKVGNDTYLVDWTRSSLTLSGNTLSCTVTATIAEALGNDQNLQVYVFWQLAYSGM